MMISTSTAFWAAIAVTLTQISLAQESFAPSAIGVTSPAPSSFDDSPAPSIEPVDSACAAYEVCAGLGLVGDCCPTAGDVFLDCCFGITPIPPPSSTTPAPSAVESPISIPDVSPTPSASEDIPAVPTDTSPAPSASDDIPVAQTDTSPAPSASEDIPVAATGVTPAPTNVSAPELRIVTLSPVDAEGCLEVTGFDTEDEVKLGTCDVSKTEQMFIYNGTQMQTMEGDMCLQGGLMPVPEHDKWVRVMPCDATSPLQNWDFDAFTEAGSPITLRNFDGFCMFPQGQESTIGDRIVIRSCEMGDFAGISLKWEIYI